MGQTEAATARYLLNSSSLLVSASPSVAAQLNATRREIQEEISSAICCKACSTWLVPGWNSETVHAKNPKQKRTRQDRLTAKQTHQILSLRCSACSTITRIESKKSEKFSVRPERSLTSKVQKQKLTIQPVERQQEQGVVFNATSVPSVATESGVKKRTRNKKSTLQSLLADRKPNDSKKGFGLDLADFMKT